MKGKIEKPIITLFMFILVDWKINSGSSDELDLDNDWKRICGIR